MSPPITVAAGKAHAGHIDPSNIRRGRPRAGATSRETLDRLEGEGRVVFRYAEPAPNGALRDIAGICSSDGRVVGLMPHPEHAIDPLTGPGDDGLGVFTSLTRSFLTAAG